jgi:hypothetical protein
VFWDGLWFQLRELREWLLLLSQHPAQQQQVLLFRERLPASFATAATAATAATHPTSSVPSLRLRH